MAKHGPGPLFFVMVLFGGIMGLLAAYGALILIRDHGVVNLDQPASPAPAKAIAKATEQKRPVVAPVSDALRPPTRRVAVHERATPEVPHPIRERMDDDSSPDTQVQAAEPKPLQLKTAPHLKHESQSIPIKFEARTLRVPITISGPIKIARIDGCEFALTPSTGLLTSMVAANIKGGPREPMLKVTISSHGDDRSCLIEPVIATDDGKTLPFTISSLEAIAKRLAKNARIAAGDLQSQQAEYNKLKSWIKSPGVRAPATYNAAVKRGAELEALIPETTQAASDLDAQVITANQLAEFARKLSGSIVLVVEADSVAQDDEAAAQPIATQP